ncbi:MAG: hypothetical protein HOI23_20505 [Deltaproteobacteria bacterium]|jgi:uncharacterized protein with NRDE domain|nr:hypothetical protein [Deltaproteobacteria bacterium]MBT6431936.1 hypothetical protein [Deltaproteobacteria bacterium]MBT6490316.1 hypothetical protein [Deltaproteobacteria bacterium]
MCSIILIHNVLPGIPLLVAANRDENKDRPAAGPAQGLQGERRILAPKDLKAGGTWLGINDAGLFVGITNRFAAPRDDTRRSRGDIPLLALRQLGPQQAVEALQAFKPTMFNAFHLLVANRDEARILWSDGQSFHHQLLEPGVHTLTESSFEAGPPDREQWVGETVNHLIQTQSLTATALQKLLGQKKDPSFHGLCVDIPEINYATRSAAVYGHHANGEQEFLYSERPPDTGPWEELSHLIPTHPF